MRIKLKSTSSIVFGVLFLLLSTVLLQNVYNTTITGNKILTGKTVLADGTISPGNSPGKITIIGDFIMRDDAIYRCELKNLNGAGVGHDQIDVSGDILLDGMLDIVLLDGYTPESTHIFEIMKFGGTLTGNFATINGLPADWQIDYGTVEPHTVIIYGPHAVGIESDSFAAEKFAFYPNPATHEILFKHPVDEVVIYDITGKEILRKEGKVLSLDVSGINAGVYLLDIHHGAYKQRLVIGK